MGAETKYNWTDNPTESGVAVCDTDVLNDCLMHLKYDCPNANIDLSNLTEEGEKHFLNKQQITNCLLEVPQRIKYDLTDGVLTIKAGSVVIVPYGVEDLTAQYPVGSTFLNDNFKVADTQYADGKFFVWAELVGDISNYRETTDTSLRLITLYIYNEAGDPAINGAVNSKTDTALANCVGYSTSTNSVHWYNTDGSHNSDCMAFPLGLVKADGTYVFGSISQIFNGMGYIGSTVWVDKGVKGLIPNERNEDGSLKNVEFTTNKLVSRTFANTLTRTNLLPCLYMDFPIDSSIVFDGEIKGLDYMTIRQIGGTQPSEAWWFDIENNIWKYNGVVSRWLPIANCDVTSGVISNFNAKQPFHAVDYNEFRNEVDSKLSATVQKATNGYMKLNNGMILQWGVHSSGSGGGEYTITLPTAFSNTNYSVVGVSRGDKVSNSDYQVHLKITSKTQFKKTGQVATGLYWFAIGY